MRKLSPGYLAFMNGQVEKEKREREREQAQRARQAARQQWLNEHTAEETCPKCGADMYILEGKHGKFLGCSNYPRCNCTLEYGDPIICPQCGSSMRMRRGKHGRFYGCSNYPTCTATLDIEEAKNHHKGVFVPAAETTRPQEKSPAKKPAPKVEKKPEPKSVWQPPSNEERYQQMVKRFPGNPKVDAEIAQYVQRKQSRIDSIIHQYERDNSNASSGMGILFGNSASGYMDSDDRKKDLALKFMKSLQAEIDEIDAYGRKCLKEGISEESAKKLIDLMSNTAKRGANSSRCFTSTYDLPQYDYTWGSLRKALPSELDGPDAAPVRKEIDCQKELISLQQEQIEELKQRIARRESTLTALQTEAKQQKTEIDICKRKIEENRVAQNAELAPVNQQLEIINGQIQRTTKKTAQLEHERRSQPLLAFKQRRALREQIEECTTNMDSLGTQAQRYEQQKQIIVSKYSSFDEELQSAMNAAELKHQQTDDQIRQLQKDIKDHITEKQLNARKLELEKMLKDIDKLEDKIKAIRDKHMCSMRFLATNVAAYDQLIEGRRKVMGIG